MFKREDQYISKMAPVGSTIQSISSHTSSWRNIDKNNLQNYEEIIKVHLEDLNSSSSGETIAIDHKIAIPDTSKIKEFIDNRSGIREVDMIQNHKVQFYSHF